MMYRYDRVIRDIQDRTYKGRLEWKAADARPYARILSNLDQVRRLFTSEYELPRKKYELCFAEAIVPSEDEFGRPFEILKLHLIVLDDDGEIALDLYEGAVDRDDLLRLSGLIEEHNDRARSFFEAFDRPEIS